MKISQLLEDSNLLYHGDNVGTTVLNPRWMMHDNSNNQEGVGIYFSPSIEIAKTYGNKISSIPVTGLRIVDSRQPVSKSIPASNAINLFAYLNEVNENFWYMVSDYVEVSSPEEITKSHLVKLYKLTSNSEIRNWQIELAQASSVTDLVSGWNRFIDLDGIYHVTDKNYAIINTNIVATPVNF